MSNLPDEDCPRGGKHQPIAAGDANDGGAIHCLKCQAMLRGRHVDALPDERRGELAAQLWRHKMARPEGEPMTWCVCLCWSTARGALADDERAHNSHVADALAPMLAGWRREDEARALREAAERIEGPSEHLRDVGTCLDIALDLRDRAARIARNYRQEKADE